ncbi:ribonuclease P protein component [Rhodobacteraceae bacterium 2CG4]|uniref:Ribonuclease P protein component n=1 Tax=Halovulum marinum TaxID=2662447 RepID=A0A6L5Z4V7_9RHOB|nr:ribonuclease P protein component [Halovulum marinum]MSU91601.1 ribonuclease P protein component [Halovulum marinum]
MPGLATSPDSDRTPATLRRRADFLAAARGLRQATPGFILQARHRGPDPSPPGPDAVRVGFTCSRKVGNAVARNRAKRRLRALARLVLPAHGRPGWDYVLIGRRDATAGREFARMARELESALERLHAPRRAEPPQ